MWKLVFLQASLIVCFSAAAELSSVPLETTPTPPNTSYNTSSDTSQHLNNTHARTSTRTCDQYISRYFPYPSSYLTSIAKREAAQVVTNPYHSCWSKYSYGTDTSVKLVCKRMYNSNMHDTLNHLLCGRFLTNDPHIVRTTVYNVNRKIRVKK